MYSSRGIGRHVNDRRSNDRDKHLSNRNSYQNSPDVNFGSEVRDYDHTSNKGYNDGPKYPDSPENDNNYGSSKGGFTPPGPPPKIIPLSREPAPSYVPTPIVAKPSQPYSPNIEPKYASNQSYEPNRTPKYNSNPEPSYAANSSYRPNTTQPPSNAPNYRQPYGRGDDEEAPETPEEIKKRLWDEKVKILFQGVNSMDDLITLKEQYSQKTQNLEAILDKSKLREGEILRNKRRNRDDFKDPAMLELKKMQSDIRVKLEEVSRFRVEIDKRIRAFQKIMNDSMEKVIDQLPDDAKADKPHNYEAQLLQNSVITTTAAEEDEDEEEDEYEYENSTKEYYDPGSHWCRDCDKMTPKINEFFEHLHTKEHMNAANNLKPWKKPKRPPVEDPMGYPKPIKTKTAIKGVQFLIPLRGFYCPLCKDYLADNSMAEEHMKGAKHNRIYNHKWNTDKGKALSRFQANERKKTKEEEQKQLDKKKKLEEQKQKEEKEAKKRKREEELKRKDKEEKERERQRERDEYKKNKSNNVTSSSDRFRLKDVTLDLKDDKTSLKEKNRSRDRERDKHKKRTRIYSSSDSSASPPRKKKPQTYFGDPMKDPKIKKLMPSVKLIRLDKKTANKFRCKELLKVIEEEKNRPKDKPIVDKKNEVKTVSKTEITIANSPITMDIDMNDDENENKEINSLVAGVLENLNEEDDHKIDKTDVTEQQKSVKDKDSKSMEKPEEQQKQSDIPLTKDSDISDDNKTHQNDKINASEDLESEPNLEIDIDRHINTSENNKTNKIDTKDSDSNDKEAEEMQTDSNNKSD